MRIRPAAKQVYLKICQGSPTRYDIAGKFWLFCRNGILTGHVIDTEKAVIPEDGESGRSARTDSCAQNPRYSFP